MINNAGAECYIFATEQEIGGNQIAMLQVIKQQKGNLRITWSSEAVSVLSEAEVETEGKYPRKFDAGATHSM